MLLKSIFPLTGDVELLAHFLEGVVGVHVDTEAHAQYLGFPCGQPGQHFTGRVAQALAGGRIRWQSQGGIFVW